jgi:hypothetical protein
MDISNTSYEWYTFSEVVAAIQNLIIGYHNPTNYNTTDKPTVIVGDTGLVVGYHNPEMYNDSVMVNI